MRASLVVRRKLVSIGGWCGPALILGKLGLRTEAYPFDFSRCTLDGVIHFIDNGFDEGFFPPGPPPFRPECVGIWVLFRGQHTAFAHFDLNDPVVVDGFHRRIERWNRLLDGQALDEDHAPGEPVTFFRTVSAKDPRHELELLPKLEAALARRNPNLDFRVVTVVHDQGLAPCATSFEPLSERTTLWGLEYTEDASKSLFDRSLRGYSEIVAASIEEKNWPPAQKASSPGGGVKRILRRSVAAPQADEVLDAAAHDAVSSSSAETVVDRTAHSDRGVHPPSTVEEEEVIVPWADLTAEAFAWRSHDNIALIDGVASVGGTCIGVGSTQCAHGTCAFCGNSNFHKAGKPFRSNRPFTSEEDELLLVHLYRILTGGDKVAAVEQLAHEMNRGAFEVICRIQFLTNASTKITEGLGPE